MNLEKVDDFLTVKELSKWIKLSESHIYFLVNKRKIPFAKLGGKLLFDKQKIKQWIDSNSPAELPEEAPIPEIKKKSKKEKKQEALDVQNYKTEMEPSVVIPNDNEVPVDNEISNFDVQQ